MLARVSGWFDIPKSTRYCKQSPSDGKLLFQSFIPQRLNAKVEPRASINFPRPIATPGRAVVKDHAKVNGDLLAIGAELAGCPAIDRFAALEDVAVAQSGKSITHWMDGQVK